MKVNPLKQRTENLVDILTGIQSLVDLDLKIPSLHLAEVSERNQGFLHISLLDF